MNSTVSEETLFIRTNRERLSQERQRTNTATHRETEKRERSEWRPPGGFEFVDSSIRDSALKADEFDEHIGTRKRHVTLIGHADHQLKQHFANLHADHRHKKEQRKNHKKLSVAGQEEESRGVG